jgi:hypothetical protein
MPGGSGKPRSRLMGVNASLYCPFEQLASLAGESDLNYQFLFNVR